MIRIGYPCQHLGLPATTNRGIKLVSLDNIEKVRAKIEQNLDDLECILRWNAAHGVGIFHIGQHLIPFASHPDFPYDWQHQHGNRLHELGFLARQLDQRLSLHPAQFINPGSPDEMHISSQDPDKQAGAHAFLIDPADWRMLVSVLDGRSADIMVEAKGKEEALSDLVA